MRFSRAIDHLREMADLAGGWELMDGRVDWPLRELWAAGPLLDCPAELEVGTVLLRLDVPAEGMPWLAWQRAGEHVGHVLRLEKRPYLWAYRPSAWPVWNARDRRVLRVASREDGVDIEVLDALSERRLEALPIIEPTPTEFAHQLRTELGVSGRHLRHVLDHFWDRPYFRGERDSWRADQLWRAAQGVREIEDALADPNLVGIAS